MKIIQIIQIIVKKDDVYGLCNKGQLWTLGGDISCPDNIWVLVPIKGFFGENQTGPLDLIQGNSLYLN